MNNAGMKQMTMEAATIAQSRRVRLI
jgi:hypothetical protein